MENQNIEAALPAEQPTATGTAKINYEDAEFDPAYVRRYSKEEWAEHATPRFYTHFNEKDAAKMIARVWELAQPAAKASSKK